VGFSVWIPLLFKGVKDRAFTSLRRLGLPRERPRETGASIGQERDMASEHGLDILVIDRDEGSNIETKALLSGEGHRPHVLTDPEQIVSEIKQGHFQLVLLDVSPPDGFGAELLQQIRGVDSDLCVVAMTAVAALDSEVGTLASQTFDFTLRKPVDRDELHSVLEALVREKGLALDLERRARLDDIRTPERRLRDRRTAPRTTAKKALYHAISRLPRGRGFVERWVRRIPGLDLPDRQVEVCTVFGTQMRINPSDNSLERSVYVRGIYEVPLTSFLLSVLPRVKVFWDVGAHVGYHTLLGSHVIGPGAGWWPSSRGSTRAPGTAADWPRPTACLRRHGSTEPDSTRPI
jgi:CheY-like chemotaxis protein